MILQTNKALNFPYRPWAEEGCAVLLCFYAANKYENYFVSTDVIREVTEELIDAKLVREDLYIFDWQGVMDHLDVPVVYLGHRAASYTMLPEHGFLFAHWFNPKTNLYHFTAESGDGTPTFDTMGVSRTVREGYIVSKRVFKFRDI